MSNDFWIGTVIGAFVGGFVTWIINYFRTEFERRTLLVVTVHRAFPMTSQTECYFIRLVNHTPDRELEIKDVWFESVPTIPILNHDRPLPAHLDSGRMWETWIPISSVPLNGDAAFRLARVRLSTGQVFRSRQTPSEDLTPGVGGIAGG